MKTNEIERTLRTAIVEAGYTFACDTMAIRNKNGAYTKNVFVIADTVSVRITEVATGEMTDLRSIPFYLLSTKTAIKKFVEHEL